MSLALIHNPLTQCGDLSRPGNKNLADDPSLMTAVYISLFCRRQARPDDTLPDPRSADRQGWWADTLGDDPSDLWGSRLWLLASCKPLPEALPLARDYVVEALQWMIAANVASAVDAAVQWQTVDGSVDQLLAIQPLITKPGDPNPWSAVWAANLALL
jgi:phage gp46-like protein